MPTFTERHDPDGTVDEDAYGGFDLELAAARKAAQPGLLSPAEQEMWHTLGYYTD